MLLCSGCDVKLMNGIYLCHSRHISSFTALSCISCAPLFFHFSCLEAPGPNSLSAKRYIAVPQPPVRLVQFQPDHYSRQQPQYSQIRQHTLKVTLPSLQSTKVPREPILITQKWRRKIFYPAALGGSVTPYCNQTTSNLIATAMYSYRYRLCVLLTTFGQDSTNPTPISMCMCVCMLFLGCRVNSLANSLFKLLQMWCHGNWTSSYKR